MSYCMRPDKIVQYHAPLINTSTKAAGVSVGHNDLWIAAVAVVSQLTVLTTDSRDFWVLSRLGLVDAVLLDANTGMRL